MSNLICRNIVLPDGRTSIKLEPIFWDALAEICWREETTPGDLAMRATAQVEESRRTSAVRVYILEYFRGSATDDGHFGAGHGPLQPEDR